MNARKARRTNVQIVRELMEFSDLGALAQVFVMDALTKHADRIASMPIEQLREAWGENPIISPEAWQAVAKEIQSKLAAVRAD